jgi:nucleoid DNA-binding protein
MTRRDIVDKISNQTGFPHADVAVILDKALDVITESLSRGEGVELRNFGVFEVRQRKPRTGRNPAKPTEEYAIPAHAAVKFKPGKEMKERVKKLALAGAPATSASISPTPPAPLN